MGRISMDLNRLKNFITVVEAGSIGRAATILHIAQPALSRQMQLLEEEVGLVLFERLPRGVRLTPGGEEFLNGARHLLKESARMVENAIHASRGEFGNLALGVSEVYAFHPDVLTLIRGYRSRYPGVRLRLSPLLSGDIVRQIDAGLLDGGFIFGMPSPASTLRSLPLLKDRLVLAASSTSDVARRRPFKLSMIHGTDLILVPREQTPWLYDGLIRLLHSHGVVPRVMLEGSNHSAIIALVAAGLGCALVPQAATFRTPPDVTLVEIDDCDMDIRIDFAWSSQNNSPALERFVALLNATMKPLSRRLRRREA
ncbi:hypothetical protein BSN85_26025 [Bradyrhizobium brasilense]|nr:hypothetical protein BSN85_26025 [Bradyrhizobium brasilense]